MNSIHIESDLPARAAWLHYAGGLTQSAVAKRLGIPTTRAHRLIARAAKQGLVRVFVDAKVADCAEMESKLIERFSLAHCCIIPDIGDNQELPLRALSIGGADYLMKTLEMGAHKIIGVGHGRTLGRVVDAMAPVSGKSSQQEVQFVSLLGGLTRKFAANPHDVIHRLAEKTNAPAYLMPVPMFANSKRDKKVLLQQRGLAEIMQMIDLATLCVVGIGAINDHSKRKATLSADHSTVFDELKETGACAELLGQFLDEHGNRVSTLYDGRMMAPALTELRDKEVIGIAGGTIKCAAILAALKSGLLTGLITDEVTARDLSNN